MKLVVVTSNPHKALEMAAFFGSTIDIRHVALNCPEYRSSDVAEIAREKARYAYGQLNETLIVDDTAFEIDALHGFPGPYAAYVLDTIGIDGILRLMENAKDRSARFITGIACADPDGIRVFTGTIHGTITTAPRGKQGFGYDPIFEFNGKTLAQIPLAKKSKISHRAIALAAFRDWFVGKYDIRS